MPRRYSDAECVDALAADYVSGAMGEAAARRMRALIDQDPRFAEAVARWRTHLDAALLTQQPPASVWQGIVARLDASRTPGGARAADRWWLRALAGLGLAVAVGIAVLLVRPPRSVPGVAQVVAVLHGPSGQGAVVMVQDREVSLTALGTLQAPRGRAYELWLIPRGGKPIGVAVASPGQTRYRLPAAAGAGLATATAFAISVEPPGGSPTGQPTGPVVLSGPVEHS